MNHLTENQLNEYLDHELEASGRAHVESHLAVCEHCRREYTELQGVVSRLADSPEEALTRDLVPLVLAKLPQPRFPLGWKLVLAAQAGVIIGMVILVLSNLTIQFPTQDWLAQIISQFTSLEFLIHDFPFIISFPLPNLNLKPSSFNVIFLVMAALLLWGVGNAILLRNKVGARK